MSLFLWLVLLTPNNHEQRSLPEKRTTRRIADCAVRFMVHQEAEKMSAPPSMLNVPRCCNRGRPSGKLRTHALFRAELRSLESAVSLILRVSQLSAQLGTTGRHEKPTPPIMQTVVGTGHGLCAVHASRVMYAALPSLLCFPQGQWVSAHTLCMQRSKTRVSPLALPASPEEGQNPNPNLPQCIFHRAISAL